MTVPRLPYPAYLLRELKAIAPADRIEQRLAQLVRQRYKDPQAGFQEEARTHREHNINTNFDTVEISGTYDQTVRTAINVIAEELFQQGVIPSDQARRFATLVRVADPTDSSVMLQSKPSHIDWVAESRSQREFAEFADWDSLVGRIRVASDPWIPLFEETEHRISGGMGASKSDRVSKSMMALFAFPEGTQQPTQGELDDLQPEWLNIYRYELPMLRPRTAAKDLLTRPLPMTQQSTRHFRGSRTNSIAAVPPGLAKLLSLERDAAGYFGLRFGDHLVVRSTEWQEAYDQSRRRHMPISRGFVLEMERTFLQKWVEANRLSLRINLKIERSITQYREESQMDWEERSDVIALNFS
jgi:hypothetical protein